MGEPIKDELAAKRAEHIEEMREALVSEINRQIQASHGLGEKAATEANIVFSRLDMDELADAAYQLVNSQIVRAWQKASSSLEADLAKLKAAGEQ